MGRRARDTHNLRRTRIIALHFSVMADCCTVRVPAQVSCSTGATQRPNRKDSPALFALEREEYRGAL
ncbi:hypothetical protein NOVOSPHI9U_260167 [Novosphingobium sp. 9U]|nr:hypothetical protein NOVOSPHI9U_260167 [Novosphingobium sp. 9U]